MRCRLAALAALALLAPASAQAGPPGTWTKVTGITRPNSNIDRLSLARTPNGVLHFLSVPVTANGHNVPVQHRSLSADAKKVSAATNVFTYPNGANQSTLLLAVPGGLRAFFAGLFPMNALDDGLATATSATGSAWAVKPTLASQASPPKSVYAASGIGGALLKNGTFLTAWGSAGSGAHLGIDPFTADFAYSTGPCCDYDPGIAVDAGTGHAIVAWKFIKSTGGMAARTLVPLGKQVKVPANATEAGQTTGITGRLGGKGGVYIAYGQGTNLFSARPAVWRFGASKTKRLSSVAGAHSVGISPGPAGRLWVFWCRYNDGYVYARRSNPAATAWGALRKIKTVKGTTAVWRVAAEGSAGPLDIFALVSRSAKDVGFWQTRILPGLSLKATKGKKEGKKIIVTLKVTDAGQAIGDAAVKVAGVGVKTTDAKGKVTFTLAAGHYGVRAKKHGYGSAKIKIKVAT